MNDVTTTDKFECWVRQRMRQSCYSKNTLKNLGSTTLCERHHLTRRIRTVALTVSSPLPVSLVWTGPKRWLTTNSAWNMWMYVIDKVVVANHTKVCLACPRVDSCDCNKNTSFYRRYSYQFRVKAIVRSDYVCVVLGKGGTVELLYVQSSLVAQSYMKCSDWGYFMSEMSMSNIVMVLLLRFYELVEAKLII